jgi:hypothetical protein
VKRIVRTAALAAALAQTPISVHAQEQVSAPTAAAEAIQSEFEAIAGTVVRIRTVAKLEYERTDRATGEAVTASRPYSVDGTGVVIGHLEVDGRVEYLILTNHHVADASNYVLAEGGYLRVNPNNTMAVPSVYEETFLMEESSDSIGANDIRLIELVRHVRGDMTLMRTVHAHRELPIFTGQLGYEDGEVRAGDRIITSGFPHGRSKIVKVGEILETDKAHNLGIPHDDFAIDIRVAPGQSGSPVFRIEERASEEGTAFDFRLIGLVHARDEESNYVVPYRLWLDLIHKFPETLDDRLVR